MKRNKNVTLPIAPVVAEVTIGVEVVLVMLLVTVITVAGTVD